ncbi:MAG: hypothetical protein N3G20_05190, partial [Verrucomicrobiae bacterium]|nr:hypothetical protein [Verrucomicrobiae bacterium]
MNLDSIYSELTLEPKAKLALVVLDGLGDVALPSQGNMTPLEAAATPNLDALVKSGCAQGRMIPVAPGITPGSGPGHLALFGYDPIEYQVGRGVKVDYARALKYYALAPEHPVIMNNLGVLYSQGQGVPKLSLIHI